MYKISFARAVLFQVSDRGSTHHFGRRSVGKGFIYGLSTRAILAAAFPEAVVPCTLVSAAVSLVGGAVGMDETPARVQPKEIVCVEPYLDGSFVKVNSNSGHWKESKRAEVAQAFSHWTWAETKGKKLVCDLQGVQQKDGTWLFTDPAVHTLQGGSGPTDLGFAGMHAFFYFHKCNEMCKGLPKPDIPSSPHPSLGCRSETTFSWEVVNASICARRQTGGTCYAHASATVIRAAESRIIGRCPEDHDSMVERIVGKYGTNGGHSQAVLNDECPKLRLSHNIVERREAEAAVQRGHAILADVWLTEMGWEAFSNFFKKNPGKVLDHLPSQGKHVAMGHTVVIVGQNPNVWFLKNSWGPEWADSGYFRIHKDVFKDIRYHHVYFLETNLTIGDWRAYYEQVQAYYRI